MASIKKLLLFIVLAVVAFVVVGCGTKDTTPPTITVGQSTITHAVNATIDIIAEADITVSDDETPAAEIVVEIKDFGGYDKSVLGSYTVTISAKDAAGNEATVTVTVTVTEPGDTLPPTLVGAVSTINHLAGEEVDLTRNINAVDNVDGTNVIINVHSLGTYNKDVPGTYVIQLTLEDSSGNVSNPFNRTIIVSESYTRAEMTSFEGEVIRMQALYNPQVFNGNTGTGFNTGYDGHYVNVLSKDYVEWLLEYAPERLGAGIGWSVIAVTDADDKIVYVRHWNSGEAYLNQDGELVSVLSENWSTGTIRTWTTMVGEQIVGRSNAKFTSPEMGLMMANLNSWIPEDGHVFIFMNWSTLKLEGENVVLKQNESDMPRSMGANYIMNSDEDGDDIMDYALGRELKIVDPELSHEDVRFSFDSTNPFPIITIPSQKYITDTGVWRERYTETVYLSEYNAENLYNPLRGIRANDGKGGDITENVTFKIYRYTTTMAQYNLSPSLPLTSPLWAQFFDTAWDKAANEVTLEYALQAQHNDLHFVVEYQVTANGHTDTAYKLIQIKAQAPDYIELYGETDTVYSLAMGLQQRLEMNPNFATFGAFNEADRAMVFEGFAFKNLTALPGFERGVVVVLDEYYRIQAIRVANGAEFEINALGQVTSSDLAWDKDTLLVGLADMVEDAGYVLVFPEGLDQAILNRALRAFYNFDFAGGEITDIAFTNGIVEAKLILKEVREVSTFLVNEEAPTIVINNNTVTVNVEENSLNSLIFSSTGGGAGFRLDTGKAYFYTKAEYAVLSQNATVISSFTTLSPNKGVPWFRDGVIIVVDQDGAFVQARVMTTAAAAEVHADGTVIFGNEAVVATSEAAKAAAGEANLTWDLVIPHASNAIAHGPLMDIMNVIPEGGAFFILPGSRTSDVRNLGIQLVWNAAYPGSGVIVDATLEEQPAGAPDPATNGFDFDDYDAAYFADLVFESNFVSTVSDKPEKISRPVISLDENIVSWNAVTGAASYDIYVNGVRRQTGVEDTSFDLRLIIQDDSVNHVRVRAITATPATASTSVLSNAVEVSFTRLDTPTGLSISGDLLTWTAVAHADHYLIYVNDVLFGEAETNEFDLAEARGSSTRNVQVQAIPGEDDVEHVASLLSDVILFGDIMGYYLELSVETQAITVTSVDEWLAKRNITVAAGGFSGMPGIFLIENPMAFKDVADQAALITANGTSVLFNAAGQVKAVRTIIGQFEWLATNDAEVNNGWAVNATYTAGQVKVGEIAAIVEEGDFMLVTSAATGKQEGAELNPRDYLAYHFQKAWELPTAPSSEGWRGAIETFENPSSAVYKILNFPLMNFVSLALEDQLLTYTTVDEWLAKRNITVAAGGFSGMPGVFYIENPMAFKDVENQAALITANGTSVLFNAAGQVKAVRTIIGQFEWLATNDAEVNNGWAVNATYTAGQVKVGEIAAIVEEGDFMLVTSAATGKQEGAELNPRDYLAYHFQKAWELPTAPSSEGWRGAIETFMNPSGVSMKIVGKPYVQVVDLALESQELTFTTVDEWLTKRNILASAGGFAAMPGVFLIEDAHNFANVADNATVVTVTGTTVLFNAAGEVKAVRTIIGDFQWLATNDKEVNNGWVKLTGVTANQVRVGELKDLVEEGDFMLITTGSTLKQDGAELNPRDFLAYHFQVSWDLPTAPSAEGWRGTIDTFLDPSTVTYSISKKLVTLN